VQEIITLLCLQDPAVQPVPIKSKTTGSRSAQHLVLGWYEVLKTVRNQSRLWHGPRQG